MLMERSLHDGMGCKKNYQWGKEDFDADWEINRFNATNATQKTNLILFEDSPFLNK